MSNYFNLTLDTTSPSLNVNMPNYSTTSSIDEVTITGNEELSDYQEIYIIDSSGKRFDLTFTHNEESKFYGFVSFHGMSIGIASLYVRLSDTVDNLSDIAIKTINVLDSNKLLAKVNVESKIALIYILDNIMEVEVAENVAKIIPIESQGIVKITQIK